MNPFLALEQYLYLGTPLKVTTKSLQRQAGNLTFYPLSAFTQYEPKTSQPGFSTEVNKSEFKLPLEVIPLFGLFLAIV